MTHAVPPWTPPALPVADGERSFVVRRIYCLGLNYAAHAEEMGETGRKPPFFFMKPADAVVVNGGVVPYPPATRNLHPEVELVAAIGRGGAGILPTAALDHVFGYAVGLDMTRRDLQQELRAQGLPWALSKSFDGSAPVSSIQPATRIGHPKEGAIWLAVNGELRQFGDLRQMIWGVAETVARLSELVALAPGDLLFTGTPQGVGPVERGDRIDAHIDGVGDLTITIDGAFAVAE